MYCRNTESTIYSVIQFELHPLVLCVSRRAWHQYLDEGEEPGVFLLFGFDDLQSKRLVTAEGPHRLLDLLLFTTDEL